MSNGGATRRVDAVKGALSAQSYDLAFIVPSPDFFYLTGARKALGERLVGLMISVDGEPALVTPRMYEAEFRERLGKGTVFIAWEDGQDPYRLVAEEAVRRGVGSGRVAIEENMPSGFLLRMQEAMPTATFASVAPLVAPLRSVKSEDEREALRRAAAIVEGALGKVVTRLKIGMTERDISNALDFEFRRLGAEGPSFQPIVGFGPNSAKLGYSPGPQSIAEGDVLLIDIGCVYNGYCSDITRTFFLGKKPPAELRRLHDLVLTAHDAGVAAAKAGVPAQDVDAAARGVLAAAGLGDKFLHRTGHGMGLEPHEEPFVVAGNNKPLQAGEVVTVEPGLYFAGRYGIRVEDAVIVTPEGAEVLTSFPRELGVLQVS